MQALLIDGDHRQLLDWPSQAQVWREGTGVLWLDLQAPTAAEMEELGAAFALNPYIVRACLNPEHRARLKEFKQHMLLVINAVGRGISESGMNPEAGSHPDLSRWRTLELNIVIGERFMLTVHPDAIAAVSLMFQRYQRAGEGRPTIEFLLYSLCDSVTSGFYQIFDRIDREIDDLEGRIFQGRTKQKLVDRLFDIRRHVLYLRRVLGPQRDALGALGRREFAVLKPEGRPYFVDVYEHTLRLFDLLDTYRDLIATSLDAYLSTVSNQLNEVMKTLTIVSTLMLPLTLITGIWGMNFAWLPLAGTPGGFLMVAGGMATLGLSMALYFRRRGWM